MNFPYSASSYDVVTAFETIYFWLNLTEGFHQIWKVLKPNGKLIIACEMADPIKGAIWTNQCAAMTIYTEEQLKTILTKSGFKINRIKKNKKIWICIEAIKINNSELFYNFLNILL